jgi:tRNA-dihydrouridine synthase B
MQIGRHLIDPPVILAPMAGITDKPFRRLCKRMGAGLAVSEMTASDPRLWKTEKSRRRIDHEGEPSPISVQIAGYDPQMLADAARFNVDHGAEIIDINMGCPAKKVCNVAAGSALLRDAGLVGRILDAVVSAVDVPVTLKIRTGYTREQRNAVEIARIAESAGVAALAVHGRTRADHFEGEAEYETMAAVKAGVGIPVIANGDVATPEKAREVLARTGCDALMIGRAAQGRPWVFRQIAHYLKTGESVPEPDVDVVRDMLIEHLEALHEFYGEEVGVRVSRKHLGWYSKAHPESVEFRARVNRVESGAEQLRITRDYFDGLAAIGGVECRPPRAAAAVSMRPGC